jgi:hypothetical protein
MGDDNSKNAASKYIRVGTQYYKKIQQPLTKDTVSVLKKWDKTTIQDDHTKRVLSEIKKYDGFCTIPSHLNYKQEHSTFYNIYKTLPFSPKEGNWNHIEELMKHIFGNQYQLGLDYIQLLYTLPLQILPVLALGSFERNTAKSTFLKFLKWIFAGNMTINTNDDFRSNFNSHWTSKLIIAIDETLLDRKEDSERIKNLSTANSYKSEKKGIDKEEVEFFGKIIMNTNHPDRFVYIDPEEIRYWVISVPSLGDKYDPNFDTYLKDEIPAFLHYLSKRQLTTENRHRMWFTPEQIHTEALDKLKQYNKTTIEKELNEGIKLVLLEFEINQISFTNKDLMLLLKERGIYKVRANEVSTILKDKWGLTDKNTSYLKYSWGESITGDVALSSNKAKGRVFTFSRKFFNLDVIQVPLEIDPIQEIVDSLFQ